MTKKIKYNKKWPTVNTPEETKKRILKWVPSLFLASDDIRPKNSYSLPSSCCLKESKVGSLEVFDQFDQLHTAQLFSILSFFLSSEM